MMIICILNARQCGTWRPKGNNKSQDARRKTQDDDGVRWRRRWHLFLAIWIYPHTESTRLRFAFGITYCATCSRLIWPWPKRLPALPASLAHSLTAALSPCHSTNLSHEIGVCDKSSRIRQIEREKGGEGGGTVGLTDWRLALPASDNWLNYYTSLIRRHFNCVLLFHSLPLTGG